jgi:hypothetical protein
VEDCRELAAKVVGGASSSSAKLDAIIAWVASEIRYSSLRGIDEYFGTCVE